MSQSDTGGLNLLLCQAHQWQLTGQIYTVNEVTETSDRKSK